MFPMSTVPNVPRFPKSEAEVLTVFHKDVHVLLVQAILDNVLVGLHHVGAEDLLIVPLRHVDPRCSSVTFQQVGTASLWRNAITLGVKALIEKGRIITVVKMI